ncbi:MAG: UDP-N-acetylmuramoyl-L-alanine--D-glutamate ligase [Desulfarculales bacterium]|jgi:UDP-N-acetylmuramoylalanine--D-glutamate ligase|nr:UDP-N-acetylmuramoyl-L-alanine--D-glutamate ligase [Desulfarculales bacterium]
MRITGKKVLVVGLGRSGMAAARLCLKKGAFTRATDILAERNSDIDELAAAGVGLSLGGHKQEDFNWAEIVVLSPGVDMRLPEIRQARANGALVVGEMSLAYDDSSWPDIMITGSNGKTTVSTLISLILEAAGRKVFAGGNLGTPLSVALLDELAPDWAVLEVSSFQTDSADNFKPRIGIVLNITPDHMDRYSSFNAYGDSKFKILAGQKNDDLAILCADDEQVRSRASLAPALILYYGKNEPESRYAAWLHDDCIVVRLPGRETVSLDIAGCQMRGDFNRLNLLAAAAACLYAKVSPEVIREVIIKFKGLPHRLEKVGEVNGITYYDDSKGTNIGAVQAALRALGRPSIVLLGGRDKNGDFRSLLPDLRSSANLAVCFGEAGPLIYSRLRADFPCRLAADMAAAVKAAHEAARENYAVLLSPGCASFDAYSGYARRGEHFTSLVKELENK